MLCARLLSNLFELVAAKHDKIVIVERVLFKAVHRSADGSGTNLANVDDGEAGGLGAEIGQHAGDHAHSLGRLDKADAEDARLHDAGSQFSRFEELRFDAALLIVSTGKILAVFV